MTAAEAEGRGVVVESRRDAGRVEALEAEWKALFDEAASPSPFLSWEWLSTWQRVLAPRRPTWILEARGAGGRLAGLLPLVSRGSMGVRRFALLGNGLTGADGLDVLARAPEAGAVRAAVAAALAAEVHAWDVLDLEDLPCGTATAAALKRALAPRGARVQAERGFTCPGFALRGTFEAHLGRIRRRETYGRRVRWLERQPGFRIEVATRPEDARAATEDFLRLHRLRWAEEGGSYGIPPGRVEDFHREVAPLLAARGWLRMYRLLVNGAAIAAVYGIEVGRRFFYYQSGYDPAWSARSPGMVLVGRTVADAYARGLTDYDFLRGTEPYKLDWAQDRRETCSLRVRAPSLRAGTAAAAQGAYRTAKGLARSVAPARVWEALRRARRGLEAAQLPGGARG